MRRIIGKEKQLLSSVTPRTERRSLGNLESYSLKHCFEEPKNQDEVFLGSHKNKALSSQSSLVVGKSKSCKVRKYIPIEAR